VLDPRERSEQCGLILLAAQGGDIAEQDVPVRAPEPGVSPRFSSFRIG
jgi:hypothetical protein